MPSSSAAGHLPRDERRRRTESAILGAARELFAETGYERATIRAVAARAGVDPALVMQHYGNKEQLFAAAAQWSEDAQTLLQASAQDLPVAALADFFAHFDGDEERDATIALMRSCLTHPVAADVMRDQVMCDRREAVAGKLEGAFDSDDAQLRASLFAACMMGLGMARYLIELEPLASASREDVERLFVPVLRALVEPGEPA